MKKFIGMGVMAFGLVAVVGCTGVFDPCSGQVDCGGGYCAPAGSVCCSETTYCNAGETCGPNNTCLGSNTGGNACEGCAANGEQCCVFAGVFEGCSPIGTTCCPLGTYCPRGTSCINGGVSCS